MLGIQVHMGSLLLRFKIKMVQDDGKKLEDNR